MMIPVGRLIVLKMVRKSELVTAMSYLTVPAILGPVVGPPLGGFIVTYYSWRWIFFINVPIGIIGIMLVTMFIEDVREDTVAPLDFGGFILTGLGLAGLVFGFEMVGRSVLPVSVVIAIIGGGVVCTALYVLHARRTQTSHHQSEIDRHPNLRGSDDGWRTVPDGYRCVAVPAGDAVAAGFRTQPLCLRHADLYQRSRRAGDEDHRGADHPPLRIPHRPARQRGDCVDHPDELFALSADHAASRDHSRACCPADFCARSSSPRSARSPMQTYLRI